MWSYVVRQARRGGKIIPLIENRCDVAKINGVQHAFLKANPVPIYSADTLFSIPENLAFKIYSIKGNEVIIKI